MENQTENKEKECAYSEEMFQIREYLHSHGRFTREEKFNDLIRNGDTEKIGEILSKISEKDLGEILKCSFRQQLYQMIIGTALVTRAALAGGVPEEVAYPLRDSYIEKADSGASSEELWKLYKEMVLNFTERVQEAKASEKVSAVVKIAQDYICKHVHYNPTLKEIAEQTGFSENYFSAMFKKETGETVTEFIQKCRVQEAENLLRYSEYSLNEISQYLGFCTQSHFAQIFKRFTGITPGKFRKMYYQKAWKNEN